MSKDIDIAKFTSDEMTSQKLAELISQKASFQIVAVKNIGTVVNKVEGEIEKKDLRCRVDSHLWRVQAPARAADRG